MRELVSGVIWVLVGALILVVVAELGLRVAGRALTIRPGATDGRFVVLCEGDSFTYGIGGESFPNELVPLLEARLGAGRVTAVNAGIPGANTALIADHIEEHLDRWDPDVVVLLAGENNAWNAIRAADRAGITGFWGALDRGLLRLRVYKFLRVAAVGWRHPRFHEAERAPVGSLAAAEQAALHLIDDDEAMGLVVPARGLELSLAAPLGADLAALEEEAWERVDAGDYPGCVALLDEVVAARPDVVHVRNTLAACLSRDGHVARARDVLAAATRIEPLVHAHHETWHQLGFAHERLGDPDAALAAWEAGLRLFPSSLGLYQSVVRLLTLEGRFWDVEGVARRVEGLAENPLFQYHQAIARAFRGRDLPALVAENRARDVARIARAAAEREVPLIVLSYPYHHYVDVKLAAHLEGAFYIDLRPMFDRAFDDPSEYLSPDNCHCNDAGYALIAEVLDAAIARVMGLPRPAAGGP